MMMMGRKRKEKKDEENVENKEVGRRKKIKG